MRIPSEMASEGAAITLGRFAGAEATGSRDGGSRNVSSKPKGAFFFEEDFALVEASAVSVRLLGAGLLAATEEFPVARELVRFDATTVLVDGLPVSGLGGASNAAALAW